MQPAAWIRSLPPCCSYRDAYLARFHAQSTVLLSKISPHSASSPQVLAFCRRRVACLVAWQLLLAPISSRDIYPFFRSCSVSSSQLLTLYNLPKCSPDAAANNIIRTPSSALIRPPPPLPIHPLVPSRYGQGPAAADSD